MVADGDLQQFLRSLDQTDSRWHEDLDLDLLSRLNDADRATAEQSLLTLLGSGDPRIPRALKLCLGESVVARMNELCSQASAPFSLEVLETAAALYEHMNDPLSQEIILRTIKEGVTPARSSALAYVRLLSLHEALPSVEGALTDNDQYVRYNALLVLLALSGLEVTFPNAFGLIGFWCGLIMTPIADLQEEAATAALEACEQLRSGASAEALALNAGERPSSAAYRSFAEEFLAPTSESSQRSGLEAMTALDELAGREKNLARLNLWHSLLEGDERAVVALRRLCGDGELRVIQRNRKHLAVDVVRQLEALGPNT